MQVVLTFTEREIAGQRVLVPDASTAAFLAAWASPPKRRGRRAKSAAVASEASGAVPVKRGPGRPPKSPLTALAANVRADLNADARAMQAEALASETAPEPKKRGRPKKES